MLMKTNKTIIDVRTPAEFKECHAAGSINIPLAEMQQRIEEIKQMHRPLVLCCASGNRSSQAVSFLRGRGIDCENGGSWMEVNLIVNEN